MTSDDQRDELRRVLDENTRLRAENEELHLRLRELEAKLEAALRTGEPVLTRSTTSTAAIAASSATSTPTNVRWTFGEANTRADSRRSRTVAPPAAPLRAAGAR